MVESIDPKITVRPRKRCTECDRVREHYNIWFEPDGEARVVCWECKARKEKGFFAHRSFHRGARGGYIPR